MKRTLDKWTFCTVQSWVTESTKLRQCLVALLTDARHVAGGHRGKGLGLLVAKMALTVAPAGARRRPSCSVAPAANL